jgi:hypothetical protein
VSKVIKEASQRFKLRIRISWFISKSYFLKNFLLYLSSLTFYLFIINTHGSQFVLLDVYMSFSIFTFVFLYKITRLKSLHIYFLKI